MNNIKLNYYTFYIFLPFVHQDDFIEFGIIFILVAASNGLFPGIISFLGRISYKYMGISIKESI